ncbi:NAD(P)H-hydrate dehydratase [Luteibacter sp. 329MFSha]|uniref:NAD(P)H-hydrate dehydratase n=1 Tax=Luteibacter sp. 329MFSha TaxID=1798239 RepID=UPI0008D69476|nr:NAD(P)H-hydrate dehydratase [Luteibacter sp. 329MFSha]SEV90733.1 yjeF C-terminal region, hydroxyethylthiazole kinase-related [Luteibacter sp. 329MFSha]
MDATRVTRALLTSWPLPSADDAQSKEDRGRVLVVGGSRQVPGAVTLAGEAALRAGAGKLMVVTGAEAAAHLGVALPEAAVVGVPLDEAGELRALEAAQVDLVRQAGVVLVGPGMATRASPVSAQVARAGVPVVADAGSLHAEALEPAAGRLVVTPHIPEMADLMGLRPKEVAGDCVGVATAAAERFRAIVVLKGPTTWIADPEGMLWKHVVDAPGLGTSGSGDVLAGVIAGFVARGATLPQAAVWGVAVHARAGLMAGRQIGRIGFLARELLPRIPRVLAQW